MTHHDDLQLLSVKDVAARLRESEGTVYRLIKAGALPALRRTTGGLLKIRQTDLLKFIEDEYQEA